LSNTSPEANLVKYMEAAVVYKSLLGIETRRKGSIQTVASDRTGGAIAPDCCGDRLCLND